MTKEILNNLKIGEQVVEMQECSLYDRTVFEVTTYTKKSFLGISSIKKYRYPFYFNTKELAEKFLQYSSFFEIGMATPDDMSGKEYLYFYLKIKNKNRYYFMIDDYNLSKNRVVIHLKPNGIWNGQINTDTDYYVSIYNNENFMEIFNLANVGLKTDKKYIFKMIEQ